MRLVYFSPVPWSSFAQRPHRFVEWFQSKCLDKVLWIDPYPTRLPTWDDLRRFKGEMLDNSRKEEEVEAAPAWLSLVSPRSLPIEPVPMAGLVNKFFWRDVFDAIDLFHKKGNCLLGIGKPSKLALQTLRKYQFESTLYDAMDDFPSFYNGISRVSMQRCEAEIISMVTRLFVSSTVLAHRFSEHSSKITLVHNACSIQHEPVKNSLVNESVPVLGYVGTIGHWFDWPLLISMAKALPTMRFRLIGPVYVLPEQPLPDNVELLPPCDHHSAISAMLKFNVGLIPFLRNDLTKSVDPIKYYEYQALGLPVLSTRFGEMVMRDEHPGVFFINKETDFSGLVKEALAHEFDAVAIQKFRKENSWDMRFDNCGILN